MAVKDGTRPAPGSVAFVPSVAGLILGGEVVKDLAPAKRTAACSSAPGYSETVGRWRDESTGDGSGAGSGDGSGAHGAGSGIGKITLAPRLSVAYNSALREMVGVA